MAQIKYVPQTPTVYLVVDRSGSMFHCLTTSELVCSTKTDTSWSKLKTAIQTVVMQLETARSFRLHDDLRDQSGRGRLVPSADARSRSRTTSVRS